MKYTYPAIFTEEENGAYSVDFPDLQYCSTCGDDLEDALFMANDALSLVMICYEDEHKEIPTPSRVKDIPVKENEFVNLIQCDTIQHRKLLNNKAVKKTLTIPAWLNESAMAAGLNFSQVLQEALIQKVNYN